jgi:hypothetical protein
MTHVPRGRHVEEFTVGDTFTTAARTVTEGAVDLFRDRLLQAGFATVALHGGLDGTPYGLDAVRLVTVARADT